jgi:DNA-binding response OmpR family regulator
METNLNINNIKLLLVEDNPRYLEHLKKWLIRFDYQHLDTARDASESSEKLAHSLYEIIVADMRLAGDEKGGFVVFEEVKRRNLTAVVIILTANDTVADCRYAHRMGAWDYISKNMKGNVFEALNESIQAAMKYLNRWGNYKDEKWIADNLAYLEEQYANQHIAVINHSVIESAETETALKQQLMERKLPLFLPVIKKIDKDTSPTIAELIKKGESATLEFKKTFQYDGDNASEKSEKLRLASLKTIVAFLNTHGGTLLIGVEDQGEIYGLENDFTLLGEKHTAVDLFEQELTHLICDRIGKPFAQYIAIRFETIDNKQVCAIEVKKVHQKKAFYKKNNKNTFYFRANCTTREIIDVKEMNDYFELLNESS